MPLWSCLMSVAAARSLISFHFRNTQVGDVSPILDLSVFLHATLLRVSAFCVDPHSFCRWVLLECLGLSDCCNSSAAVTEWLIESVM